MEEMPMLEEISARLDKALARGVKRPVALLLSHESAPARAVYAALRGRDMRPLPAGPGVDEEGGLVVVAEGGRAAALLRQHAGPGGAAAADHVEDDVMSPYGLAVALRRDDIAVWTCDRGRLLGHVTLDYDRVKRSHQTRGQLWRDEGPSSAVYCDDSGRTYIVYGRTGRDVMMAAGLVAMVLAYFGRVKVPDPRTGELVPLPVTEEMVRGLLLDGFSNSPHPVAEAVTALRHWYPPQAAWLERLLEDAPELQALRRAVHAELTGEEG
jgi:hypothetical protein